MRHPNRWLAMIVIAVVAADWLTKFWIANRIALGDTLSLIDGWLYLAHHQNPGVAFSTFASLPDSWRTPLLALLSMVGAGVLAWMAYNTRHHWIRVGSAFALAGAIGNLGDRLLNGAVTDFIQFTPFPFIFNVADAAITFGAILLILHSVGGDEPSESPVHV